MADDNEGPKFNLMSSVAWPIVTVISLLLFKQPIAEVLSAVSSGSGADIQVPGITLKLPKAEVPEPPDAIKDVLPKLEPDMITFIMANYGGNNRVDTCYKTAPPDEMRSDSVKADWLPMI